MGYFVGLPLGGAAEKDCQVRFGKNMTFQVETGEKGHYAFF